MLSELNASLQLIVTQTQANYSLLLKITLIPWCVLLINGLIGQRLFWLGIFPRKSYGLLGILFAPLLHANFNHLFFNTIPFVVLSDFILIDGLDYFLQVTLIITVLSGFLIWCFAKNGLHIGASALITGYWALLITRNLLYLDATTLILAGISLYYFMGIFFGIFPQKKGISWEGHLFGLFAGIATPYLLAYIYR